MDTLKQNIIGSRANDKFKQLHKRYGKRYMYACDIDFIFVSKRLPGIIAILDYKRPMEQVHFSQVLAFNDLMEYYPIYLIEAESPEFGPFFVYKYKGGDWHPEPPIIDCELITICETWKELIEWEDKVRKGDSNQCKQMF